MGEKEIYERNKTEENTNQTLCGTLIPRENLVLFHFNKKIYMYMKIK